MDTKPLESFAKAARRELIVAVEARVSTVLAAGSVARSERAETVRLLESEIANHGRAHVIDRVAYTWFNRLIALRFMDARGYTDAGIVSPASGQAHGQPEILADAKRGDINTEVVTNASAHEAIIGLLDGTRRSTDGEGEAYALLLTEVCRYWHKSMPFMFEAEGAYTELLVPAGLLADGALLSRAREVLTEEVCDDVEVIGWLYQFYISERKDEIFVGFKKNKKAGADEIPAATQLFTPHWIVRYLLENSLGQLWMLNRPTSRLVDQMDYYIAPIDEETDFLKVSGPEELTVIDPACGSGHMLTYAFDLLYSIYEEEGYAPSELPSLILAHNLHGTEIDPRAGALASFALTMKARARDRRFFARAGVQPNVCVIEPISFTHDELDLLVTKGGDRDVEETFWNQFRYADTLGSLIQPDADSTKQAASVLQGLKDQEETLYYDTLNRARKAIGQAEVLRRKYSVVTANPPYMGSKSMDVRLAAFAKENFPDSKSDLFAMFIERACEMITPNGYMAQVTMQSWMFLSSYEALRSSLARRASIRSLIHMDNMVMRIAFGTCATVWKIMGSYEGIGSFAYLEMSDLGKGGVPTRFPPDNPRNRSAGESLVYLRSAKDFLLVPGAPIAYWLSDAMLSAFSKGRPLGGIAEPRKGLDTGNNALFLRMWWEVSQSSFTPYGDLDRTWFPYNKGGEFRRWYGNREHIVNWSNDGELMKSRLDRTTAKPTMRNLSYMKRSGFSWGTVTSGGFSARFSPSGALFDNGGCTLFTDSDPYPLGALVNSTTADAFLSILAPTLNYQPGDIAEIPTVSDFKLAGSYSRECVRIAQSDWDDFEFSWDFKRPSWLGSSIAGGSLRDRYPSWSARQRHISSEQQDHESNINCLVAEAYGLQDEIPVDVPLYRVSLTRNVEFRYGAGKSEAEYEKLERGDLAAELISYAVGCMFGRYSLDEPSLILADQGAALQDYLGKDSTRSTIDVMFLPDADNVIPFVDDGWFEDDVVEQSRRFLKAALGTEHFEENLRFVEESLGVKTLRDYFITKSGRSKFYDDHVKRYKKRPIYWMFSSPEGSFNALIYLHRYTSSTVSTVLNEYLREYENKLQKAFERAETAAAGGTSAKDQKEADRLRKVLAELRDYEHDVLYPLATQQVEIDLDDGVKVNYPKFYPAVKKIVGLEASDG